MTKQRKSKKKNNNKRRSKSNEAPKDGVEQDAGCNWTGECKIDLLSILVQCA